MDSLSQNERIQKQFMDVRKKYFPRWDKRCEWKIAYGTHVQLRDSTGYCDSVVKTVFLHGGVFPNMPEAGQLTLIIHEICHDVAAASHNRTWALRMKRASERADSLGELEVAENLRNDIDSYFCNDLSLEYNLIGILTFLEEVPVSAPNHSYDALLKRVSDFFGYRPTKIKRDFGGVIQDHADRQDTK